MRNPKTPLKIAVLVSGSGSNLQALIDKKQDGSLPVEIVGVISNKADAYALHRAQSANIATAVFDKDADQKKYTRRQFEELALDQLQKWQPDLVVLAGFMRVLTPFFIDGAKQNLKAPMINLHPSLLPHYKGLDTHRRVLRSGEKKHGCSVHLVSCELDAGAVLTQASLEIEGDLDPVELQRRAHALEHKLLPWTVFLFASGLFEGAIEDINATAAARVLPLPWRLEGQWQ